MVVVFVAGAEDAVGGVPDLVSISILVPVFAPVVSRSPAIVPHVARLARRAAGEEVVVVNAASTTSE